MNWDSLRISDALKRPVLAYVHYLEPRRLVPGQRDLMIADPCFRTPRVVANALLIVRRVNAFDPLRVVSAHIVRLVVSAGSFEDHCAAIMSGVASALNVLFTIGQTLYAQSRKTKDNREEYQLLATHVQQVLELINARNRTPLTPQLEDNLEDLSRYLAELTETMASLNDKPWLKRFWWANDISDRIRRAYKRIDNVVQLFELASKIDTKQLRSQNKRARDADARQLRTTLQQRLDDSESIFQLLGVRPSEIPEAKVAIQKLLHNLQDSSIEKRFFEQGLYALQSRSGHFGLEDADKFSITSLEVIRTPRRLGTGGFGTVYEGKICGLRSVAIKELDGVPEPIVRQEIKTWKVLEHENIVELLGAAPSANPPFIVCDYMANGEAMAYLARNPGADRRRLLCDASRGLIYLHMNGVIHGDLKAANILIDAQGRARLSDFGLSVVRSHTSRLRQSKKRPGPLYGTAPWMAPELLRGDNISTASDVYGFAMTMYEIYSGTTPFASIADDPGLLFTSVVDRRNRPARPQTGPGKTPLEDDVWHIIERAWNHEPSSRPKMSDIVSVLDMPYHSQQPADSPSHSSPGNHRKAGSIQVPMPSIEGVPLNNVNGHYYRGGSSSSTSHGNGSHTSEDSRQDLPPYDPPDYFTGGWQDPSRSIHNVPNPQGTPPVSTQPDLNHQMFNIQLANAVSPDNTSNRSQNVQKPHNLTRAWERFQDYTTKWTDSWDIAVLHAARQSTRPQQVVNDVALTVWMMHMYKRRLRYLWGERLHDVVDVLTVPPLFTAKINKFLSKCDKKGGDEHSMQAALKVLRDLWSIVRHCRNAEPKVVLVVGQHDQDKSRWLVHKISLLAGNICTYETINRDSRPVSNELPRGWWTIIRSLWPHVNPRSSVSVRPIYKANQPTYQASISAAIIWRNLLQDFRSDREADLDEIRSSIKRDVESLMYSRFHPEYTSTTV